MCSDRHRRQRRLGSRICHALARNGVDVVVNYAAGAAERTLLRRTVDKDDVAEQLITRCRSDSVTGQTILMDSGRV